MASTPTQQAPSGSGGGRRRAGGRPRVIPSKVRERIRKERLLGDNLKDIARKHGVSVGFVFNETIDL